MKTLTIILLLLPLTTRERDSNRIQYEWNWYFYHGFWEFKSILAQKESFNNPNITSKNGYYRGLYQFGKSACKDIKVDYDSLFIPRCSDTALVRYMKYNYVLLKDYQKYIGDTISGVNITMAGLLAAAHLKGHIWVKRWIKSNGEINSKDLNGTSVRDYMKLMENVELIKY